MVSKYNLQQKERWLLREMADSRISQEYFMVPESKEMLKQKKIYGEDISKNHRSQLKNS